MIIQHMHEMILHTQHGLSRTISGNLQLRARNDLKFVPTRHWKSDYPLCHVLEQTGGTRMKLDINTVNWQVEIECKDQDLSPHLS